MKRIALALLTLLTMGAASEGVAERRDRRRFQQIGRSVDIGGRSLNVYCSGEGSPAVVMDSGRGRPGYSWLLVQPRIAGMTRACWYDRAGIGWSDRGPSPRSSDIVARDLHELLRAASIPPPYVLVGHSMGGFNVRLYHRLFPGEVVGMVLVDARQEDMETRIPDMPRSLEALCPSCPRAPVAVVAEAVARLGLLRLLPFETGPAPNGMTSEEWERLLSLERQPGAVAASIQEYSGSANDERMRAAVDLGSLPLVVLTAGNAFASSSRVTAGKLAQVQRDWIQVQGELARQSARGKHVVVAGSGHMIPFEAPDAVIGAVRDVLGLISSNRPAGSARP